MNKSIITKYRLQHESNKSQTINKLSHLSLYCLQDPTHRSRSVKQNEEVEKLKQSQQQN